MKHVNIYGERNWSMANKLIESGRGRSNLRHRYSVLKAWQKKHPGESLHAAPRRQLAAMRKATERKEHINTLVLERLRKENKFPTLETVERYLRDAAAKKTLQQTLDEDGLDSDDEALMEYFQMETSKPYHPKGEYFTQHLCDGAVGDVRMLLKIFGAELDLPGEDEIRAVVNLDEQDKKILCRLKSGARDVDPLALGTSSSGSTPGSSTSITFPSTTVTPSSSTFPSPTLPSSFTCSASSSTSTVSHLIPPNNATMTAFKNIILDINNFKSRIDYSVERNVKNEEEESGAPDAQLFRQRFKSLLKWPALMATTDLPEQFLEELKRPEVKHKCKKPGRPPNKDKLWKINRMREKRWENHAQAGNVVDVSGENSRAPEEQSARKELQPEVAVPVAPKPIRTYCRKKKGAVEAATATGSDSVSNSEVSAKIVEKKSAEVNREVVVERRTSKRFKKADGTVK